MITIDDAVEAAADVLISDLVRESDELAHYGVLGMKWGRRKVENKNPVSARKVKANLAPKKRSLRTRILQSKAVQKFGAKELGKKAAVELMDKKSAAQRKLRMVKAAKTPAQREKAVAEYRQSLLAYREAILQAQSANRLQASVDQRFGK